MLFAEEEDWKKNIINKMDIVSPENKNFYSTYQVCKSNVGYCLSGEGAEALAKQRQNNVPQELSTLSSLLDERIEKFLTGDKDVQNAALKAAKYIFDLSLRSEFASREYVRDAINSMSPSEAPLTRAQARAAAQEGEIPKMPAISSAMLLPTPLSELFTENMDEDQIWAQLDLKAKNVCETLEDLFDETSQDLAELEDGVPYQPEDDDMGLEDMLDYGDDGDAMDEDEDEDEYSEEEDYEEEEGESDGDLPENVEELRDPSDEDDEESSNIDLDGPSSSKRKLPVRKGHAELDDGFFNLAEFNAEIEEAEAKRVSRGSLADDSDDSEGEENVDIFAPVDADEAFEEEDEEEGSKSLFYKDFFEPPSRSSGKNKQVVRSKPSKVRFHEEVKVKTIKNKGRGVSLSDLKKFGVKVTGSDDDDDEDEYELDDGEEIDNDSGYEYVDSEMQDGDSQSEDGLDDGREAVERLKDDLFADEEESQKDQSTHEARMAQMREQISALEAENVAEKDWVLKGEVTSRARPVNSLLEEDLDYERVTKPVPVITEEAVQDLESRIKARITEGRFDDVIRRKAVDDKPFLPSRVFELQDTKSKESLSQIYENEYMATQSGVAVGNDRDGKLKKEHEEIEKLWDNICYKLDALCNAHYTPKQPKALIQTVTNTSTITLESALPTSTSVSTILAPEEVFATDKTKLRARTELTPTEAQALRSKERKKKKKQREQLEKSVDKFAKMNKSGAKSVKKQKEEALKSVVKSGKGVTVIGKKSQDLKRNFDKTSKYKS